MDNLTVNKSHPARRSPNKLRKIGILSSLLIMSNTALAGSGFFGLALRAEPKYGSTAKHVDYANPNAKRGGTLNIGAYPGAFDTLNPYQMKGTPAPLLTSMIFETLATASWDEAFTNYGLLAEHFELSKDELSAVFKLNPNAKFSDGKKVTADDVVFSYRTLITDKARPFYKMYWADVKDVRIVDKQTVKFDFAKKNPELHMILGQIPVLPKHIYGAPGKDFGKDFSQVLPVGTGPYVVKSFEFGKNLRYERNPQYWGKDLAINVGRYNFDAIQVKAYRDATGWFEGFKAGDYDLAAINSSKQWAKDVVGEKWDKNWIVKKMLRHSQNQGNQGFVLNERKPLFKDRKVRQALALALDFAQMNKALFFEQYTASVSYFNNSEFAATGLPSPEELRLLEPLKANLAPEVFSRPMGEPVGKGLNSRQRLMEAQKLLEEAGWKVKDGVMRNAKAEPFEFTFTLDDKTWERIVEPYMQTLSKIGVKAKMQVIDASLYEKKLNNFDFDAIVNNYPQSESLGNEQRDYWGSKAADAQASSNYSGIKNAAIDSLIEAVVNAPNRKELVTAARALDRSLWFEYLLVPHWYIGGHRITYWNKFSLPKNNPSLGSAYNFIIEYGWFEPEKVQALNEAIKANRALPAAN